MAEKYLYFRTEATDGSVDASVDSAVWPASSLAGMHPSATNTITLYFTPMVRRDPTGSLDNAANLDNQDSVVLTLTTAGTHLNAFKSICQSIQYDKRQLIVIANDDSGGTEYLIGDDELALFSGCGAITVQPAYTNA